MRWESLVPVAGGRHCEACRQTVIDVERLSAAEVDALVESGERACVRVTTLSDGSILTRDHPRAARRAAAWASAALAASAIACSERTAEEDASACMERETRDSARSVVEVLETPAVDRPVPPGPTVGHDRAVRRVLVGRVMPETSGEIEAPPPMPALDLTAPVSDPAGLSDEESSSLGSIVESATPIEDSNGDFQ